MGSGSKGSESAYAKAGVDIDAQDQALSQIKKKVEQTFTPGVLSGVGSFGGLYRPELGGFEEPVLVASADGVGTKLRVAQLAGDYSTVGHDLVNHCVNDILVQGARPLFFLDYVGAGVLRPDAMEQLVDGVVAGCKENGCALLGGETAEMPGFYQEGDYELVGFVVGLLDRKALLDGSRVQERDVLVGLPSAGLHTNGYTLARQVFLERLGLSMGERVPGAETQATVQDLLLSPHLSYLQALEPLLDSPGLHALVHVTGGGLTDNLPRVLPKKLHAEIRVGAWDVPEVFHLLQEHGEVATEEMFRVFNMGVGMVALVAPEFLRDALALLRDHGQPAWPIGTVQGGGRGVVYDFPRDESGASPLDTLDA